MKTLVATMFALASVFTYNSCRKKPELEKLTFYMDNEFKDYTYFAKDSYWIYQDSASGNIDSNRVYYSGVELIESAKKHYNFQGYNIRKSRSYYSDSTLIWSHPYEIAANNYFYYLTELNLLDFSRDYCKFYNLNDIGYVFNWANDYKLRYFSELDTITIANVTYYSVKVFENITTLHPLEEKKLYYSKNIGIIRKELFNGEVWNLIRHNVKQ